MSTTAKVERINSDDVENNTYKPSIASEFVKKIIGAMARAARVGMQKPYEQQTTSSAE